MLSGFKILMIILIVSYVVISIGTFVRSANSISEKKALPFIIMPFIAVLLYLNWSLFSLKDLRTIKKKVKFIIFTNVSFLRIIPFMCEKLAIRLCDSTADNKKTSNILEDLGESINKEYRNIYREALRV